MCIKYGIWKAPQPPKEQLRAAVFSLPVSHVRFHIVQAAHYAVQLLTLAVQDSGCVVQMLLGIGNQTSQLLPLVMRSGGNDAPRAALC